MGGNKESPDLAPWKGIYTLVWQDLNRTVWWISFWESSIKAHLCLYVCGSPLRTGPDLGGCYPECYCYTFSGEEKIKTKNKSPNLGILLVNFNFSDKVLKQYPRKLQGWCNALISSLQTELNEIVHSACPPYYLKTHIFLKKKSDIVCNHSFYLQERFTSCQEFQHSC